MDVTQDPRFQPCLEALMRLHAGCPHPEEMSSYERGMVAEFLTMLDAALLTTGGIEVVKVS